MIGRIVRSADFERVLGTRSRASSQHFAVHHLPEVFDAVPRRPIPKPVGQKLSTGIAPEGVPVVDDFFLPAATGADPVPAQVPGNEAQHCVWLGAVVPKRHARRSVTRSLLKRQIRAAVAAQAALGGGLWIVRLRAPFDRTRFPSAASLALRCEVRAELDGMLARAAGR